MDSVRVERTPAVLQAAATTESAYCPYHPSGAHEVQWTSVLGRPKRSGERTCLERIIPTGHTKVRRMTVLLHARMSHTGLEPVSED